MRNYDILRNHCKKIFFAGSGNFWFETGVVGDDNRIVFKTLRFIMLSIYTLMTIFEILAAFIGNFPDDEKSDSVTFAVSHTIVMIKIFTVIKNKDLIKKLNKNVVHVCEKYEKPELIKKQYRIIMINIIAYFTVVYGSAACFVFEGLRKMYAGSHFVTVVTYYPSFNNNSTEANIVRFCTTVVLMFMLITMIVSVDSFTMMHLIIYKYKFITLRQYFENLRKQFDKTSDLDRAVKQLTNGLREGIIMHSKLISMSKEIDGAFGLVIAMQVFQSSGSAISLLLQLLLADDLTFVARMKIIFFVVALFFLLGLFLCNAGEITYQASLILDSIFQCGWHLCPVVKPPQMKIRSLVLLASMQAQRPLVMKAFKMLELTCATFIMVIKSTYSVFAVFYAQRK